MKPSLATPKPGGSRLPIFLGLAAIAVLLYLHVKPAYRDADAKQAVRGTTDFSSAAARNLTQFRSQLFLKTMQLSKAVEKRERKQIQPPGYERFELLNPFVTCPQHEGLRRIGGSADGSKLVCPSLLTDNCVVFSLGSRGDTAFEQDLLSNTPCKVVTFDCTVEGQSLGSRHTYVQKCLGASNRMKADPTNWITLQAAMKQYAGGQVTLLKMDIEGFEHDVLSGWDLEMTSLPLQISMELHYWGIYAGTKAYNESTNFDNLLWPLHEVTLPEISLLMMHLANMGYAIVSREDNAEVPWCSELTFLRVGQ